MKIVKNNGTGAEKALDVTVMTNFGPNVVRINIDDDSDNLTTRFHIPWEPTYVEGANDVKVLDYISFPSIGSAFYLEVHSPLNASNVYYRID